VRISRDKSKEKSGDKKMPLNNHKILEDLK
jgi:hypothetical protein